MSLDAQPLSAWIDRPSGTWPRGEGFACRSAFSVSREPLPDGDFRGHLPEREIMTGIGPVAVRAPRVRDRTGLGADRIRFSSALLPPYVRRSKSLEVLIPVL